MMEMIRSMRAMAIATGLAVATAFLVAGCGSGTSGETPAAINPELEKKTQDMLKNKSQQYNERYRAKGGRPG
jgi:F0F1-type ATP synthase membrane subunit c/vacuolar-type H+-ATPase subunit K